MRISSRSSNASLSNATEFFNSMNKDSLLASGYSKNILDHYEKRPDAHPDYDFDNMSLVEFAMLFEPHYQNQLGQCDNEQGTDEYAYETEPESFRRKKLITLNDNTKW
ncbi:hypothetical protein HAZT_HAZT011809 [Hyalella azteca]|uniref:Uncharacterized protein n=1 Tax=Hyalella azteca TaxID=294128 RepID=A0A6A0HC34_HYAAZ|nr:hypothetical protein HAZT_HAZT011809 [Hyalella azteca]